MKRGKSLKIFLMDGIPNVCIKWEVYGYAEEYI